MESKICVEIDYCWKAHDGTCCSVLHVPEKHLLISGSYDDSIRIWNLNKTTSGSPMREKIIRMFDNRDTNCVIRWDDNTFLCGAGNGTVTAFSLNSPYETLKAFNFHVIFDNEENFEVMDVIRLNQVEKHEESDRFAVVTDRRGGEIGVVSYSTGKLLHHQMSLDMTTAGYSNILQSSTYPNAVFFNSSYGCLSSEITDYERYVFLLDFTNGNFVKKYSRHLLSIFGIETVNRKEKEYLVCGGNGKIVYVYDVVTEELVKEVEAKNSVSCFLRLGSNHLLVGEGDHNLEIISLDLEKEKYVTSIPQEKEKAIFSYRLGEGFSFFLEEFALMTNLLMSEREELSEDGIRIAVGSACDRIWILRIKNLVLRNDQSKEIKRDTNERLEYLLYDESRYVGVDESRVITICSVFLVKHEILRLFL